MGWARIHLIPLEPQRAVDGAALPTRGGITGGGTRVLAPRDQRDDYRNQRREFLEGIWNHVDWDFIAANLANDKMPNMSRYMTLSEAETISPAHSPSP